MESSKSLGELAKTVGGTVLGSDQIAIADVTHDSRQVGPGTLFVAIEGGSHDGHQFVPSAIEAGAVAVCVTEKQEVSVPQLVVFDSRGVLGELAAQVHDWPSRSMDVIGVTGTNGKTTVTHYIESLLSASGTKTGLVGTISTRIAGKSSKSVRTTPEASDLQRLLAFMRDEGVEKVALEVSSHALELGRVDGTTFRVAAFTNLSQDHLDFHGTMADYRKAKERLFTDYDIGTAVINIDDAVGAELAQRIRKPVVTVGRGGDFEFSSLGHEMGGTEFTLESPQGSRRVLAPVHGDFNVSNLAIAIACCFSAGAEVGALLDHISAIGVVPGRFQRVPAVAPMPGVIVDYAHTPTGIALAIETARLICTGSVIVVIGAGGDRDRVKRPLMGDAASGADLVVVTSDNPRSEDPESIVAQVSAGVTAPLIREVDRRAAIAEAISVAGPDDLVLVLGKGHEQGQEVGGKVLPFDDMQVALESLKRLRKSAKSGPNSGSISL